jgi:glutathione S-transferase
LREELRRIFIVYDGILAKQAYIGGNEFAIGDLFHAAQLDLLIKNGEDTAWKGLENVERWIARILERETWIKISANDPSTSLYKSEITLKDLKCK